MRPARLCNTGTGGCADTLAERILDPAKVTRLALQNAASVAGLLLTTEVMIAEASNDESDHVYTAPCGMGGMGRTDPDLRTKTGAGMSR